MNSAAPSNSVSQPLESPRCWSDEQLVRACLKGDEAAWNGLVEKYKRLIYSIPLRYGASRDDAADIFQAVCLEIFSNLSQLQNLASFRSWLISITIHKSYHWKKQHSLDLGFDGSEVEIVDERLGGMAEVLEQLEREQMVRDAIAEVGGRCAVLVKLLFYENPPIPYAEAAKRLGLAKTSIGFIRGRCLKRLEQALTKMGF